MLGYLNIATMCDSKNVTPKLSAAAGFSFSTRCEGQLQGFGPTLPKKESVEGVRSWYWSDQGYVCVYTGGRKN